MPKIDSIIMREISLRLREPFRISSGTVSERRILLLEISDGEGITAWAECVAGERPNYSYETIDTAWLMIRDHIAPRVLASSFESPADIRPLLDTDFRGHNMAKAAVEMGIWELEARRDGVSLSEFLGGERDSIEVGVSVGIQPSPEALVERVRTCLEEGYRKIKIKIMPGADVAYAGAVREALGFEVPLMADANSAYTLDDLETLKALDNLGLMMIEQPLAHDDLVQHAALQAELETPICLDESITGPERAMDMLQLGSGRIVNIKPGRVGGFSASVAIRDICEDAGVPVWCGGMLESGVGRGYNVALASLANFTIPGDISPSARYWEEDIVEPEWTMVDGTIRVPLSVPGTGVGVIRDRVEEITVRTETVRAV